LKAAPAQTAVLRRRLTMEDPDTSLPSFRQSP
jgi:hypothetical protein